MLFRLEKDLCCEFLNKLQGVTPMNNAESFDKRYNGDGSEWKVYPECCGYDFVLVNAIGEQIGVQAKLRLSIDVIEQILPFKSQKNIPDWLAVLVPSDQIAKRGRLVQRLFLKLHLLLLTESGVIPNKRIRMGRYSCTTERLKLPTHVGNIMPGGKCPRLLSDWKIRAIKLHHLMIKKSVVTARQFAEYGQVPRFWLDRGWTEKVGRGVYRDVFGNGPIYAYKTEASDLILELSK